MLLLALSLACSPAADPAAPAPDAPLASPTELAEADAVAAADFDGDGVDDPVLVRDGVARWMGQEVALDGVVQVVARGALAGLDGEAALIATGMGRGAREAPAAVWALTHAGAERVWESTGERNQVTSLQVRDGNVWLSAFADAWTVAGGWLARAEDGAWTWKASEGAVMALRQAAVALPDGREAVVLGRLYGDTPRSEGDLRVRVAGSDERVLPTLRGVRSLATGDLDGDGAVELVVGDGWSSAYAREGDARIRLFRGPSWDDARTIGWLEGEYTANELFVVGGDVLAVGSTAITLLRRDGLGWATRVIAPVREVDNAVPFRAATGPAVLISGAPAKIVPYSSGAPRP